MDIAATPAARHKAALQKPDATSGVMFKALQPSTRLTCDCCPRLADRFYPRESAFVCSTHHETRGAAYAALYQAKHGGTPSWDRTEAA